MQRKKFNNINGRNQRRQRSAKSNAMWKERSDDNRCHFISKSWAKGSRRNSVMWYMDVSEEKGTPNLWCSMVSSSVSKLGWSGDFRVSGWIKRFFQPTTQHLSSIYVAGCCGSTCERDFPLPNLHISHGKVIPFLWQRWKIVSKMNMKVHRNVSPCFNKLEAPEETTPFDMCIYIHMYVSICITILYIYIYV